MSDEKRFKLIEAPAGRYRILDTETGKASKMESVVEKVDFLKDWMGWMNSGVDQRSEGMVWGEPEEIAQRAEEDKTRKGMALEIRQRVTMIMDADITNDPFGPRHKRRYLPVVPGHMFGILDTQENRIYGPCWQMISSAWIAADFLNSLASIIVDTSTIRWEPNTDSYRWVESVGCMMLDERGEQA